MIVDGNILLYAVDEASVPHEASRAWLVDALNGDVRVGLPWPSLSAFLRISTNPRASANPLDPAEAWSHVREWLDCSVVWIPTPTDRHASIFGGLVLDHDLRANMIPDAHLAALAIEHGLAVVSADTDFARFPEVTWINPLV